jgi:hypothetical protein
MQYLFRLTIEGEDSIRTTDALVGRLRQLWRTSNMTGITVHVYDGSMQPENHLGTVPATQVLMAQDFDPAWLEE